VCDGTGGCAGEAYDCVATQCQASSTHDGEGCVIKNKAADAGCDDAIPTSVSDVCDGSGGCSGTCVNGWTGLACDVCPANWTGENCDQVPNGLACTDGGTPCASGSCYEDFDGDRYDPGNASPSSKCQPDPQLVGVDCDDNCGTCFPGSTATTPLADGFDQDCNGAIDDTTGAAPKVCDLSATGQTAQNGLPIPTNQMCQANGGPAPGNYQPQGMVDGCAKWCENGGSQANPMSYNPSAGTVSSGSTAGPSDGYPGFNWDNCNFLPKTGFGMNHQGRSNSCALVGSGFPIRTCTCSPAYALTYH
jgi:hypothetical protein